MRVSKDRHGHAARAADPDIQKGIDALFGHAVHVSVLSERQHCIVNSAREAGCKKECHAEKGMRLKITREGEGNANHETVMEPVVKPKRSPVEGGVVYVEGTAQLNGEPVGRIVAQMLNIGKGMDYIGPRGRHNQSIVKGVKQIVHPLYLIVCKNSVD